MSPRATLLSVYRPPLIFPPSFRRRTKLVTGRDVSPSHAVASRRRTIAARRPSCPASSGVAGYIVPGVDYVGCGGWHWDAPRAVERRAAARIECEMQTGRSLARSLGRSSSCQRSLTSLRPRADRRRTRRTAVDATAPPDSRGVEPLGAAV